jgi:5-methyltetrahydrofolate--homocysteine methyltransferase
MKMDGREQQFIIIGENIHTTRVVLRNGKLVAAAPDGSEAVRYTATNGEIRYLVIPDDVKRTQDYDEGRVKHIKIAVRAAMAGQEPAAGEGIEYIRALVERQVKAGADFLDLNVDEISLRPEEQKEAIRWLVRMVEAMSPVPLSVDSSNMEIIQAGLEACEGRAGRPLLNSASLERMEALDVAKSRNAPVIVTAAGQKGMPEDDEQRVANASRMVDGALAKGIALRDIFVDALVFPISVDSRFGNHCLDAIRRLRQKYGPEIHITGGLSNVSFGLPCRRLINDVWLNLAVAAGADSGIIDPVATDVRRILSIHTPNPYYVVAEDVLLGRDRNCKNFLRAYRKGEIQAATAG